jgi:hypothetical protein
VYCLAPETYSEEMNLLKTDGVKIIISKVANYYCIYYEFCCISLYELITFPGLKTDSIDDFFSTTYVFFFSGDYGVAKNVAFESKMETDLYEFVKCKTFITSMSLSPDGKFFATWVRIKNKGTLLQDRKITTLQLK